MASRSFEPDLHVSFDFNPNAKACGLSLYPRPDGENERSRGNSRSIIQRDLEAIVSPLPLSHTDFESQFRGMRFRHRQLSSNGAFRAENTATGFQDSDFVRFQSKR